MVKLVKVRGDNLNKKKLLIYAHYFYPDIASTAQILCDLCKGLQNDMDITVICTVPSYTGKVEEKYKSKRFYMESYDKINIIRVRVPEFDKTNKKSRIKNLLTYLFNSIIATCKLDNQDYIFTISQPPILGGILGLIGKVIKGGKFIYNIQDFNPEQTIAVGYVKNKLMINAALSVDKFTCKHSDEVIVVGRDMLETLQKRFNGNFKRKSVFINNWIDEKEIYPLKKEDKNVGLFRQKYGLKDKFVIMYSGNIGLYYDLENIIKVTQRFQKFKDVIFAFVGDGSIVGKLKKYASENKLNNVIFIPYQKKEDLNISLNSADVHFVVNAKGIKGVSVPSKLYGVMAAGKPAIAVLEDGSEARMIIEECGCGICSNPGDYESLYNNILWIINNKEIISNMGIKGRFYLEDNLTKDYSINKYKENILSI